MLTNLLKDYADDQTYYLSGLITATKSSKAEAMADWERGLRYFPNSGILNYEMAIANRSLKDNDKAIKYIKKAVKANPNNSQYKNLEKELSKKVTRKLNNFYDVLQLLKNMDISSISKIHKICMK